MIKKFPYLRAIKVVNLGKVSKLTKYYMHLCGLDGWLHKITTFSGQHQSGQHNIHKDWSLLSNLVMFKVCWVDVVDYLPKLANLSI